MPTNNNCNRYSAGQLRELSVLEGSTTEAEVGEIILTVGGMEAFARMRQHVAECLACQKKAASVKGERRSHEV